jgi:RND family efflux transporter MFP subunit
MPLNRKAVALAAGIVAAFTAVALAQVPTSAPTPPSRQPIAGARPAGETLVVTGTDNGGTIDWIERSAVSALREGVIDQMELQVGMEVQKGKTIGRLHDETARLTVSKAQLAANNLAAIAKGKAQKELAIAKAARLRRLNKMGAGFAALEEIQTAEAEVKVADALVLEAEENQKLAGADLELARQALHEHTITAPFDGIIIERMKNPGESVRANEAVVQLGKVEKVRFFGYLPLETAYRVRLGSTVDVTPIAEVDLPITKKRFRGKITFVGPELVPVRNQVQIFADITNNTAKELLPGLKANMTIYLDEAAAPAPPPDMLKPAEEPAPILGTRAAATQPPR